MAKKINGSMVGMFLVQRELSSNEGDYFFICKNKKELENEVEDGDDVFILENLKYNGRVKKKVEFE